jgi:hypothetical protein
MAGRTDREISVGQDTTLGSIGIRALADKFCGPACDLSGLPVRFFRAGSFISVSFYDMDVYVGRGSNLYGNMNRLLEIEEARGVSA